MSVRDSLESDSSARNDFMFGEAVATAAVLILTPGWAIALLAVSAYIWKFLRSRSD